MKLGEIGQLFAQIRVFPFVLAVMSFALSILISALRWKYFVEVKDRVGLLSLFRVYLVALFLANFLPSGAGLDLARAGYLMKATKRKAFSVASVAIDRIFGFVTIVVFVFLGLFLGVEKLGEYRILIVAVTVALLGGTLLGLTRVFHRIFERVCRRIPLGSRIFHLYESFYLFRGERKALLLGLVTSPFVQFFFVFAAYLSGWALGLSLPLFKLLLYVSAINFLSMIPVTISGIGVREGGFVLFFHGVLSQEEALALSVLYFLSSVAVSLVGGGLIATGRDTIRSVEPRA
jgi:hypothetical protein